MKTFFDCLSCLIRQTLDSVRSTTDDEQTQESILRDVLKELAEMDFQQPPAAMAQAIHRRIRETTGNLDPYAEKKRRLNDMALKLYPVFARRIEQSADPLELAARLAIAGNIMDLGVKSNLDEAEMIAEIDNCLAAPLDADNAVEFAQAIDEAENILYLTDNSGEIVFDRLLMERLPREKLTAAVRGAPIINDATIEDAEYIRLAEVARVIDNGSDSPGTILDDCSEAFRRHFERADLIIAKGQGNYETLAGSPYPIFFLLRIKCSVIARDLNLPVGTAVLTRSPHLSNAGPLSLKK
ncbi:MAG: ARMT1-like domain-containing protein [Pirellulales bacterium]|nr:ARMT1-like domain-containing protein [Pirellulales bacterium]